MRYLFHFLLLIVFSVCSSSSAVLSKENAEKSKPLSEEYLANQARGFLFDGISGIENGVNSDTIGRMAQILGILGREDLTDAWLPRDKSAPECGASIGDPITKIVSLAQETSIVIINEAHHQPRDRDFIRQTVRALYETGYHIYAAEVFNFSYTGKPDPKLPIMLEGFYIGDPIFGRLVRDVKTLGFTLIAYEQTSEQLPGPDATMIEDIKKREAAQSANLMAAVFTLRPGAKVIIHVGFRHAAEEPLRIKGEDIPWMAARLKVATGIDPLTISLTDCYANGDEIVLGTETKGGQRGKTKTDVLVGMPLYSFTNNRPDWRRKAGDVDTAIPEIFLGQTKPVIVEARRLGDTPITVPEDRILLLPGDVLPLLLPPGEYQIEAWTRNRKLSEKPVMLTVSAN